MHSLNKIFGAQIGVVWRCILQGAVRENHCAGMPSLWTSTSTLCSAANSDTDHHCARLASPKNTPSLSSKLHSHHGRRWQDPVGFLVQCFNPHLMPSQLPQTCLVSSWRLVLESRQLESKHCDHDGGMPWDHRNRVESQCGARGATTDARAGKVLSESMVRGRNRCWRI